MMSRKLSPRCQVCRHAERWRIQLLRAGGASLDSLGEKFGVHRDAVHRHWRDHVPVELKAGYLAGPVQLQELAEKAADEGGSILDHLHAVRVLLMGQLACMVQAGDGRGAAYVAGRLTSVLETIARVSGELGSMAHSINVTNNVTVLTEHPAFLRMQAAMLRAFADDPAARAKLVTALRELDSETSAQPEAVFPRPMRAIEHHVAA